MPEEINIENSIYEFDILLVSEDGKKAVPLTKSSVRYLEIEDNLANIGLKGKAIISNYYGLLQKLNVFNVSSESPNIFIRFRNLDFKSANSSVIPELFVLATLGKSTETSANVVERHVVVEFEEKSIVTLKRKKVNDPDGIISISNQSPAVAIKEIFKKFCPGVVIKDEDIKAGSVTTIPSTIIKFGDSAYDIVKKCYDHLAYEPSHKSILSPGLVQLEIVQGGKQLEKKLVVKSLAEDIKKFFEIAVSKSGDASKYLIDKFTVAFSDQSGTLKDNFITKYDVIRVDYEDVFENKWSNISKKSGDVDISKIDFFSYEDLRSAFEELFTRPYYSNLPRRNSDDIKILTYNYPGDLTGNTTTSWATNKTMKSFIYDNTALIFKVKGQPYRIPGRFIRINTDDPLGAKDADKTKCASFKTDKDEEADSLNGWWYVLSVQHIFENDIYFNRITAVKIYLPVELPSVSYGIISDDGGAAGATGTTSSSGTGGRSSGNSGDKDGDGIPDVFDANPDNYDNYDYTDAYPFSPEDMSKADEGLLPPLEYDPRSVPDFLKEQESPTPNNNSAPSVDEPGIFRDETPQRPIT